METVRSHLVRFADAFQTDINLVTAPQIDAWLKAQNVGPRIEIIFVAPSQHFFGSPKNVVVSPKGPRPERMLSPGPKIGGGQMDSRPAELVLLLRQGRERVRLFLALGAFTGTG